MWYLACHIALVALTHWTTGDNCLLLLYSMNMSTSIGNLGWEAKKFFQPHNMSGKAHLFPLTEENSLTLYLSEYAFYKNRNVENEESGVWVHTKVQCLPFVPEMGSRQLEDTDFGMKWGYMCYKGMWHEALWAELRLIVSSIHCVFKKFLFGWCFKFVKFSTSQCSITFMGKDLWGYTYQIRLKLRHARN